MELHGQLLITDLNKDLLCENVSVHVDALHEK